MIKEQVAAVIQSVKPSDGLDLRDETGLIEHLGFTSLDVMNLILALEQRFEFSFKDEDLDLERFLTFGAVLNTLRAYDAAPV